jgi:flagellar hook protein FlgE
MTQGFYTAISGMGAAQTKIDVIADNIANMNTVGFKESNVVFENLFSRTLTVGNAPFGNVGGKNPMQVGSGAQISSIIRNFTNGNYQTTGRDKDLLIQGSGFFSVQDPTEKLC